MPALFRLRALDREPVPVRKRSLKLIYPRAIATNPQHQRQPRDSNLRSHAGLSQAVQSHCLLLSVSLSYTVDASFELAITTPLVPQRDSSTNVQRPHYSSGIDFALRQWTDRDGLFPYLKDFYLCLPKADDLFSLLDLTMAGEEVKAIVHRTVARLDRIFSQVVHLHDIARQLDLQPIPGHHQISERPPDLEVVLLFDVAPQHQLSGLERQPTLANSGLDRLGDIPHDVNSDKGHLSEFHEGQNRRGEGAGRLLVEDDFAAHLMRREIVTSRQIEVDVPPSEESD